MQAKRGMAPRWKIPTTQPRNRRGQDVCPVCRRELEPGRRTRRTTDGVRIHSACWQEAIDRATPG